MLAGHGRNPDPLSADHTEASSKMLWPGPAPLLAPPYLVYVVSGGTHLTPPGTTASVVVPLPLVIPRFLSPG